MDILQPKAWARPKGYSNGIAAVGRTVAIAGQTGWNPETETFETDDFAEQCRQALMNVRTVLAEAGAAPEHIVRMTWYVTDMQAYVSGGREVGAAYREIMGKNYPAMTLVQVVALVEGRAKVEIEATAVLP